MEAILSAGTQLFGMFTDLVGNIAPVIDNITGTNVLGSLISQMGLPSFAGMVLLGMVFGE